MKKDITELFVCLDDFCITYEKSPDPIGIRQGVVTENTLSGYVESQLTGNDDLRY